MTPATPDSATASLQPVILAGGSGTRLWPLSRGEYPKQLLRLRGDNTLLQDTVLRLEGALAGDGPSGTVTGLGDPIVVCNEEHRFLILEQLEAIARPPARVLLEPVGRNTAPALTIAAHAARADGADPVLLVMPADHVIADLDAFHGAVRRAAAMAAGGAVVTFGIVPDCAETGYGYIRKGAAEADGFAIREFVEKPDLETARRFLDSGEYFWNSGMFLMRASVWLEAAERLRPDIAGPCARAYEEGKPDGAFLRVDRDAFFECASDSIDYAVMEKLTAERTGGALPAAAVVPLAAGWSDIGSWSALKSLSPADAHGNVVRGDVYTDGTRDSLVVADHRLVAAIGLEGVIVVETPDAVLVADQEHSQEVKQLVGWLAAEGRTEGRTHRRVYRPWGYFESIDSGDRFQVKRLAVKPGAVLSLQMHHHRAEHWVVVRGTAKVTRGEEEFLLTENQSTYIPLGTTHRLENPGRVPLEVVEVQSGSYLGEDDIVRFADRYHRENDG